MNTPKKLLAELLVAVNHLPQHLMYFSLSIKNIRVSTKPIDEIRKMTPKNTPRHKQCSELN